MVAVAAAARAVAATAQGSLGSVAVWGLTVDPWAAVATAVAVWVVLRAWGTAVAAPEMAVAAMATVAILASLAMFEFWTRRGSLHSLVSYTRMPREH